MIYVDLSGLKASEHEKVLENIGPFMLEHFEKGDVPCIFNFEGTKLNSDSKHAAEKNDKILEKYGYKINVIVIGITGLQKIIVQGLKRDFKVAKNLEEAKALALASMNK